MLAEERLADASGWRNQSPLHRQAAQPAQPAWRIAAISAERAAVQPEQRAAIQPVSATLGATISSTVTRTVTRTITSTVTNKALHRWLVEALTTVCVLGGVLAAPVLAVVAWVGLLLPAHTLLHLAAPTLMVVALVWLIAAILGAHVSHLLHTRRQNTAA